MRSFLSVVVMLALYIMSLMCTATGDVIEYVNPGRGGQNSDVSNGAVVTTTTTAAAKVTPEQVDNKVNGAQQLEKGQQQKQQEPEPEVELEHDVNVHGREGKAAVVLKRESGVDLAAAAAEKATTTTAANAKPVPLQDNLQPEAKSTTTGEVTSGGHTNTVTTGDQITQSVVGADISRRDVEQQREEQKRSEERDGSADLSDVKGHSIPEEKTTTTTAAIHKPSDPKGDNRKKQSNGPQNKESPDLEVKDAIPAGQSTNPLATKTGREGAQSSTTSGGATGGKKEQKASSASSPTTATTAKKDNHGAIKPGANSGEKTTIQKQKETSTTTTKDEPTMSTVAPTTRLPNGFKIPQSLDKTDGSRSPTVLFAFATVVTFTVLSVTPV